MYVLYTCTYWAYWDLWCTFPSGSVALRLCRNGRVPTGRTAADHYSIAGWWLLRSLWDLNLPSWNHGSEQNYTSTTGLLRNDVEAVVALHGTSHPCSASRNRVLPGVFLSISVAFESKQRKHAEAGCYRQCMNQSFFDLNMVKNSWRWASSKTCHLTSMFRLVYGRKIHSFAIHMGYSIQMARNSNFH